MERQNCWQVANVTLWNLPWSMAFAAWPFLLSPRGCIPIPSSKQQIAVRAVREVVKEHPEAFDEILWALFDDRTKLVYDGALQEETAEI